MKSYVKMIDDLPLVLKVILALPFFDWIVYGIYRIAKGRVIIGVLWFFLGWIGCILDIISLIAHKQIKYFV